MWVLALALCRLAGIWERRRRRGWEEEEEEEGARSQSFPQCPSARPLPVLQLSGHSLGDPTAQQPHQEEDAHAQCDHQQDVVLRGRCHHLHSQVREALRRRHLQDRGRGYRCSKVMQLFSPITITCITIYCFC